MLANRNTLLLALALMGFVATPVIADGPFFQAANLFQAGNRTNLLPGAATLTRTQEGVSFGVHTSGLAPGAYTIWIVIFNRPENCAAGGPGVCMGPDLGNPDVEGSVVYGTGAITGLDGVANFHGSLNQGKPPDGIQVNVPAGTANGLKDSKKAEIHLVVRAHGSVMAGNAVNQLTTFEPCSACMDLQAVAFEGVK